MTAVLLSLHVLAAIVAIGPICVAASMFPAQARLALSGESADGGSRLAVLARISRVYAFAGIAVPVLGLMTGASMGVLTDVWLVASVGLTLVAFLVLALVVLPRQQSLLDDVTALPSAPGPGVAAAPEGGVTLAARQRVGSLAASTGVFNLLWATVTVLMIVRPGSTTGI